SIVADHGVEAEQGLEEIALEPLVEIVAGRFGEEIEEHAQIFSGQPAQPVAKHSRLDELAKAAQGLPGREVRGRAQDEIAQDVGAGVDLAVEGTEPCGIGGTELGSFTLGPPIAGQEIASVTRGK